MDTKNKITWKNIKLEIEKEDKTELIKLISSLYSLSKENKSFLNMKFYSEQTSIESIKNKITKYINPQPMTHQKINIVKAKKIISNYYKATKIYTNHQEINPDANFKLIDNNNIIVKTPSR